MFDCRFLALKPVTPIAAEIRKIDDAESELNYTVFDTLK